MCIFAVENTKDIMETNDVIEVSKTTLGYIPKSYADVMMMLYTMPITKDVKRHIGLRLVKETNKGSYLAEAFDRLSHLSTLEDGWAGDGSYAISRDVLRNVKSVLLVSEEEDWQHWMISPDVNGTLLLQSDTHIASISIGEKEFSYLSKKDGCRNGKSHIPFDAESMLNIMRSIY